MSAHGTKGSKGSKGDRMTWVGRAIRRVEDPALITGQGRFTADLAAAHWVRFVRSPVAAGKIKKIGAASLTPNQRMATGIHAIGEIGRRI